MYPQLLQPPLVVSGLEAIGNYHSLFGTMKRTAGEVAGHPLWMLPVFLLIIFGGIQAIHTTAHWYMEMDVHGYCSQNKEYLEKMDEEEW